MDADNVSQVTDTPFKDTNNNLLQNNYEDAAAFAIFSHINTITDCIKIIIYTCVVAADLFLVYIFSRSKELKCKANRYILHYAIWNILHITIPPLVYFMVEGIRNVTTFLCIIIQIENACLMLCFLLAFGLGVDWLLMTFSPGLDNMSERVYSFSIPIIYSIGFTKFLAQTSVCFLEIFSIRDILSMTVYGLVLVFILILNYLNGKYKLTECKKTYSLTIANIMILTWLPMYIYQGLTKSGLGNENFVLVLRYTAFIPEWIAYGNSIVIFIALVKLNKPISKAFLKVFTISRKHMKQHDVDDSKSVEGDVDEDFVRVANDWDI